MTDTLKRFFSDVETASFFNLSKAIMPGHYNQSVTFTLDQDYGDKGWPPALLAIWEGDCSPEKRSSEWIYMHPDDARSIAHVLLAYADAWQERWDRFENGEELDHGKAWNAPTNQEATVMASKELTNKA
ncbi:hypothetical protein ACFO1V_02960 [Daeguia caeni]|uniref:Uncharacterized protein n=1 Tax=Daeguia caeni TaxID=439612 RepID=A0ABV9H1B2_9HYPH